MPGETPPHHNPARAKPRVVLLTHDSIYSRAFLDAFQRHSGASIVGVVLSTSYLHRGRNALADLASFVWRVGFGYSAYQFLATCLIPFFSGSQSPSSFCKARSIPLIKTKNASAHGCVSALQAIRPDFLLSFHFNQKLEAEVASTPKIAAINFHPSLLPSLQGVDPVFFHLATAEGELGMTLHHVTDTLDGGRILAQAKIADLPGKLIANNLTLFAQGGMLAAKAIDDFESLDKTHIPQGGPQQSYYGWRDIRKTNFWRFCLTAPFRK